MKTPITQSKSWLKFQNDLGEKTFYKEEGNYSYLAILKDTPLGNYLYLPYGPVAKDKTSFKKALNSLSELAKENNAFFVRIEPQDLKFKTALPKNAKKTKDLNPGHTLIIDISREPSEILGDVPRRTRGYFNTYSKKGIKVEVSKELDDIKHLVKLQKSLANDKKIGVFPESYLKKQLEQPFSKLYLVKYQPEGEKREKVIASVLVFDDEDTRYYIQAAQDKEYTKLAGPSIIVCQMMIDAHNDGLKYFDFWGIAPENAPKNHPWKGFTNFKKSFGGESVEYAGTYDIVLKPLKYHLYQIIRKINRLIRHI